MTLEQLREHRVMVVHYSECPALPLLNIYGDDDEHVCTCTAAEQLRELVEAAGIARGYVHNECNDLTDEHDSSCLRITAALAPFREYAGPSTAQGGE